MSWYANLPENTRITLVGVCAVLIVGLFESFDSEVERTGNPELIAADYVPVSNELLTPMVDPGLDEALWEKTTTSVSRIDPLFGVLMREGAYGALNNRMLSLASKSVSSGNKEQLAEVLALLGEISIEQQNLSAAEVYLFEALDVMGDSDNELARAEVYMQLGRTYLKSRQIARNAGYAYDALQIGRTQLNLKQFHLAETNFRYAIDQSLEINRYNAAASAYESLSELYRQQGQTFESEEASLEAVRLYSSSGQAGIARKLLEDIRNSGIEEWRLLDIEQQIIKNREAYEQSITQIGTARDYQRLYNYYLGQGDHDRAWHFRLLAGKSLEEVSKRAMFHRQQGVLALLYNSNEAMTKAKSYFAGASNRFSQSGADQRLMQISALDRSVY